MHQQEHAYVSITKHRSNFRIRVSMCTSMLSIVSNWTYNNNRGRSYSSCIVHYHRLITIFNLDLKNIKYVKQKRNWQKISKLRSNQSQM